MKGKGVYKGKHWTQLPENRERLLAMARKGAKRRNRFRHIAKDIVRKSKHISPPKRNKTGPAPFVVRTHGYRIILDKNEIRIETDE